MRLRAHITRCGRSGQGGLPHDVAVTIDGDTPTEHEVDALAGAVYRFARPRLASREVEAAIYRHEETGGYRGLILVGGWRTVGEFEVHVEEEVSGG